MPQKDLTIRGGATGRLHGLRYGLVLAAVTCCILFLMIGMIFAVAPISIVTRNTNLAPTIIDIHGSLRRGRATLEGGYVLSWQTAASVLWVPHLDTRYVLEGNDTRITGALTTGPRGIALHDTQGRAGPGLAGLIEGAWECDMTARVTDVSFSWGWRSAAASGGLSTPEGSCSKSGQTVDVPPLVMTLGSEGNDAVIALSAKDAQPMATVKIRRKRVFDILIQPSALKVFPQLPSSGPIALQLPF